MQGRTTSGRWGGWQYRITRSGSGLPRWTGFVLIGFGLFFALALARYQVRLALFGTYTIGEVVAFEPTRRPAGPRAPRVRITTESGRLAEFRGASLRGVPLAVGDRVPVLYIDGDPVFGEIATFRRFWLGLIVGGALSISLLAGGGFVLRRARRRAPRGSVVDLSS